MPSRSEADNLRRKVVICAAGCACLAAAPALSMTQGHHIVAGACIALQVVLITAAIRYLVLLKRLPHRD